MNPSANKIFQFIRGAIRGAYGKEDFHSLKFLIIGTSEIGQELISALCILDIDLLFQDTKLVNYGRSFSICSNINYYRGEQRDVIINLISNTLLVRGKEFSLGAIKEEPYTQGIHEYYLR